MSLDLRAEIRFGTAAISQGLGHLAKLKRQFKARQGQLQANTVQICSSLQAVRIQAWQKFTVYKSSKQGRRCVWTTWISGRQTPKMLQEVFNKRQYVHSRPGSLLTGSISNRYSTSHCMHAATSNCFRCAAIIMVPMACSSLGVRSRHGHCCASTACSGLKGYSDCKAQYSCTAPDTAPSYGQADALQPHQSCSS